MAAAGTMIPALLRESIDEGFHGYKRSRALDPVGFAEYGPCARANMLYDRIATSCRELMGLVMPENPDLSWKIGDNKRSTEVKLEPYLMFRIKRVKKNRGGRSTSVGTNRQWRIMSDVVLSPAQMIIDFPNFYGLEEDRIWLTAAYDLDDLEESLARVSIGVETRKKFLWKLPLHQPEAEVIAGFPTLIAGRILEMRALRSA